MVVIVDDRLTSCIFFVEIACSLGLQQERFADECRHSPGDLFWNDFNGAERRIVGPRSEIDLYPALPGRLDVREGLHQRIGSRFFEDIEFLEQHIAIARYIKDTAAHTTDRSTRSTEPAFQEMQLQSIHTARCDGHTVVKMAITMPLVKLPVGESGEIDRVLTHAATGKVMIRDPLVAVGSLVRQWTGGDADGKNVMRSARQDLNRIEEGVRRGGVQMDFAVIFRFNVSQDLRGCGIGPLGIVYDIEVRDG